MLIRQLSADQYQLVTGSGVHEGALDTLVGVAGVTPLTLVIPAQSCILRQVGYARHEKRHLHKIIPFSLEDDLIDRVDDLHFAIGQLPSDNPDAGKAAAVCVVEKTFLAAALAPFRETGLNIQRCLPETLLLPWQPGQWTLVFPEENRCLIRTGFVEGMACSRDNLALTLSVLARNLAWPGRLQVIESAAHEAPLTRTLLSMMPGLDTQDIVISREKYWQLLARADTGQQPVNLLSGQFAPSLPWGRWWQHWKVAAMLVMAIGAADLVTKAVEIRALDNLNAQAAIETQAIFRQVIPEGELVDAALQLQRRLEGLTGNGGAGFVALLDKAAPVIMDNPDLAVENLDYSERDRQIQLTLITRDFNTAESARARLQSLGLQAELTGSSSTAAGNRSRLIIGNRG